MLPLPLPLPNSTVCWQFKHDGMDGDGDVLFCFVLLNMYFFHVVAVASVSSYFRQSLYM